MNKFVRRALDKNGKGVAPATLANKVREEDEMRVNEEFLLRCKISGLLLAFADEKDDLATSEFQERADTVAREIIDRVRWTPDA